MKGVTCASLMVFGALVVLISAVTVDAISCKTEPERCKEGECCVEFGPFGYCRQLKKEGERCELNSLKSRQHDHMFMMMCPYCTEGLTCNHDGSSSLTGTCG